MPRALRRLGWLVLAVLVVAGIVLTGPGAKDRVLASPVELVVWTGEDAPWKEFQPVFEAEYPDITLKIEKIDLKGAELNQFITTRIISKKLPDIIDLDLQWGEFIGAGLFKPIDEYIERDGVKDWPWVDPAILTPDYDGHYYSLPRGYFLNALWYNVDLAKELGVYDRIPKSWDDPLMATWNWDTYVDVLKQATRDRNGDGRIDVYGTDDNLQWGFSSWIATTGRGWTSVDLETGRVVGRPLDDPDVIDALQFLADLALVHKVAPAPGTDVQAAGINIESETVVMRMMGSWAWQYFETVVNPSRAKEGKPPIRFAFAPYPAKPGKEGQQGVEGWLRAPFWITASSEHPEEAWQVMKFFNSPEYLTDHFNIVTGGGQLPVLNLPSFETTLAAQVGDQQAQLLMEMLKHIPEENRLRGMGPGRFLFKDYPPGGAPGGLWNTAREQITRGQAKAADVLPAIAEAWREQFARSWEIYDAEMSKQQ